MIEIIVNPILPVMDLLIGLVLLYVVTKVVSVFLHVSDAIYPIADNMNVVEKIGKRGRLD